VRPGPHPLSPNDATGRPLGRSFYDRPTVVVARALLGCRLVRSTPEGARVGRLVETEAYVARDPANHAYRGPTDRNRSMFGRPGTLYVYRIYQVYCANAVTRPGEAVLLRAVEPVSPELGDARGPGRLCRVFGLTRDDDGRDLTTGWVNVLPRDRPLRPQVVRSPRIGIREATDRPLRFSLQGSRFVSYPHPWSRARTGEAAPDGATSSARPGSSRGR
jgi:DNA-3-methyladenine glycosylase